MPKATSSSYSLYPSSIKVYAYTIALILLSSKAIPFLCSYYNYKGLKYIALVTPLL